MNKINFLLFASIGLGLITSCNQPNSTKDTEQKKTDNTTTKTTQSDLSQTALTLPVLDALFYEPDFAGTLKSKVGLTDAQIEKLKSAAHTSLRELNEDGTADAASARSATQQYETQIKEIIGENKLQQLQQLVAERYSQGVEGLAPTKPNFVPADTRIVVNAPAFRMDVFQDGN
jgi:PBP1b-binding outer membrane lipoprotein LpoB